MGDTMSALLREAHFSGQPFAQVKQKGVRVRFELADARGQVPVRAAIPVNRPAAPAPTPAAKPEAPPLNSVRRFFQRGSDTPPASDANPPRATRP